MAHMVASDRTDVAPIAATGGFGRAVGSRLVIIVPYLWLFVFFLVPFLIVFKVSLSFTAIAMPPYTPTFDISGGASALLESVRELTADNYRLLLCDAAGTVGLGDQFNAYCASHALDSFSDQPYITVAYASSIKVAAVSTLLTLLVGFPIAYGMARAPAALRPTLLMLVILPFWTSFLIRVYAWIGILKPEGLLNQLLMYVGVIDQPLIIMNTYTAIYIGIVYSYLPFMVLPLYSALEKMDYSLVEAAQDLGCPPIAAFWKITFPLALPGVVAGSLLVLIPAMGEFVIPDLLGGSQTLMIGKTLWNEFFNNRDWPVSSAVAVILLLLLVVPIMLFQQAQARSLEKDR